MGLHELTVTEGINLLLGQTKKDIINDTNKHDGAWGILYALTDVVFGSVTDANINSGSLAGVTLKAGGKYYGKITSITLTSGSLVAYSI